MIIQNETTFNRRKFIRNGLLILPMIYIPKYGNKVCVELFNKYGSNVFWIKPGSLNAASVIKARTFSSIVDNRIKLQNSNFARLWSTDIGTSWTKIRVACRMSIENTPLATSTPRFIFGISSGTSNIYMDATTTHWSGFRSVDAAFDNSGTVHGVTIYVSKKISTTITDGSTMNVMYMVDCTAESRSALCIDITKGSPNFSFARFARNGYTTNDVDLSTFLSQIVITTPVITNHTLTSAVTLAIDEVTNGYFNAVNIGWDRTSPAIEISDIAVVKLA